MRLFARFLTGLLCAGAARAEVAPVSLATVAERLALPAGLASELRVEGLSQRVVLVARRDAGALLKALVGKSRLCPEVAREGDAVVLRCTTRKLDAALASDGHALDLRQLRGLPWREGADGPPRIFYEPVALQLGAACPGDTTASRAECALAAGKLEAAEQQLTLGLDGPFRAYAALRLGDLALRRDDPEGALAFYESAGASTGFGQLAVQRRHELLGLPPALLHLDRSRLPALLANELLLREVRALAFAGAEGAAALQLKEAFLRTPKDASSPCAGAEPLCRRLALAALQAKAPAARQAGLLLFLAFPDRVRSPALVEVAEAAADVAAEAGAPLFGANLLSACADQVTPARLEAHLLRAAELYAEAGQVARRDVIVEYARLHVAEKTLRGARWVAVMAPPAPAAAPAAAPAKKPVAAELKATELPAAEALLARARALTAQRSAP